jgi:hypothetical protein
MRLFHRVAAAGVVAAFLCVGMATTPAHAEEGYTYWGYYHLTGGEWVAADTGAAEFTPEDGALEGYHFATTTAMPDRPPRTDLTFDDICAGTEAAVDRKRVAVALDYGLAEENQAGDEPPANETLCAVVPTGANGQQVLDAVAQVRVEGGLTCGINGYPSTGCSVTVADATPPASEDIVEFAVPAGADEDTAAQDTGAQDSAADDGWPWPLIGVGALVLVLVAGGVLVARRRGRT